MHNTKSIKEEGIHSDLPLGAAAHQMTITPATMGMTFPH